MREERRGGERGGLGGGICTNVALGTAPGIGDRIPYVIIQGPKGTINHIPTFSRFTN